MKKEWKQEENGVLKVRSCAWSPPGDHPVGCGLQLTIKGGKLVKVEGDPEHPITQGRLCIRCLTLPEYIYNKDRIIYPMKRAFEDRGKDKWERISWDEALDTIEAKVRQLWEESGPESIVVFTGTGREATLWATMLGNGIFATPNVCYAQSGWSCYGPRVAITSYILGASYPELDYACRFPDRYDHEGWQHPNYVIVWGKEPLKSNPDGLFGHALIDLMKLGTKLIVVDPRVTWLASKAEFHLQLRPQTDAALALGMLNVIINEDLYDHDFVEKWTYGFDQFKERVHEYPPSKVAEITWVPEEKIIAAARAYAKGTPSSMTWGLAVDQNPNGVQLGQALCALMCITGNLDVPGGVNLGPVNYDFEGLAAPDAWKKMTPDLWRKRIGTEEYPAVMTALGTNHPDSILDTLETGKPYPLRMAFFQSSNLIAPTCSAQPKRWHRALKKLEFNVASDLFMNPTTMALADIFLPLASMVEHDGVVLTHYGMNMAFYGAMNKAISVGECKSDVEIMIELGHRLNPEEWDKWNDPQDILNDKLGNFTFDELREAGTIQPDDDWAKYEKGMIRPDGKPGFNTPTGRIELYSTMYESFGDDPLPYYLEGEYGPLNQLDKADEYPLVMTSGARTYTSFHSEHRQIPTLRAITPNPMVEIHPDTAALYGIKEGDKVLIENMFGEAEEIAHLTKTIMPKIVHASHGWWYPEEDGEEPHLYGNWRSNINSLIPHKSLGKMGFGAPFKGVVCKISRVAD